MGLQEGDCSFQTNIANSLLGLGITNIKSHRVFAPSECIQMKGVCQANSFHV